MLLVVSIVSTSGACKKKFKKIISRQRGVLRFFKNTYLNMKLEGQLHKLIFFGLNQDFNFYT